MRTPVIGGAGRGDMLYLTKGKPNRMPFWKKAAIVGTAAIALKAGASLFKPRAVMKQQTRPVAAQTAQPAKPQQPAPKQAPITPTKTAPTRPVNPVVAATPVNPLSKTDPKLHDRMSRLLFSELGGSGAPELAMMEVVETPRVRQQRRGWKNKSIWEITSPEVYQGLGSSNLKKRIKNEPREFDKAKRIVDQVWAQATPQSRSTHFYTRRFIADLPPTGKEPKWRPVQSDQPSWATEHTRTNSYSWDQTVPTRKGKNGKIIKPGKIIRQRIDFHGLDG